MGRFHLRPFAGAIVEENDRLGSIRVSAPSCSWRCHRAGPPRPPRRPHFTDVAARSKISYVSNNSPGGRKYFPQPMCGGVAVFDFDNDGRLDIFFTNGAQLPELKKTNPSYYNCLLKQRADGTFEDVTIKAGLAGKDLDFNFGVAVGDYDNDGYEDLFICSAGRNALYHNNGDGTFTDVTAASGIGGKPPNTLSVAAAWFDYDNDGLLDLIVDNYTIWTPQTDMRCAIGGARILLRPAALPERTAAPLSQSGPRQVRGCHR